MVRALVLFLLLPTAAQAEVPARYRQAAAEYGLPAKVVYAVALTESGLRLQSGRARPWPWTLNIEGQGHYYPTRKAAYRALKVYLDRRRPAGGCGAHADPLARTPQAPAGPLGGARSHVQPAGRGVPAPGALAGGRQPLASHWPLPCPKPARARRLVPPAGGAASRAIAGGRCVMILRGGALEQLAGLSAGSVQMCLSSPPPSTERRTAQRGLRLP